MSHSARIIAENRSSDEIETCDLLVIGSGAGGLAAAVSGAAAGLRVILAEKCAQFGGTTVSSAGVVWIPCNSHQAAAGITDDREAALTYLRSQGGNRFDSDKGKAYVTRAADVLDWFEHNSDLRFDLVPGWPDYHPDAPGGSAGGRSLGPAPFDGRSLGHWFARLRPPLATTTIMGGMVVGRQDLVHFFSMLRSRQSFVHVAGLFVRHAADWLRFRRGTRLSNGVALIAMLARTALRQGVDLRLETRLESLEEESGRITGAVLVQGQRRIRVAARAGVVLAAGGFPGDDAMRSRLFAHVAQGRAHRSLAPATNTGDAIAAARHSGAAFVADQLNPAAWTPVSLVPQPDGGSLPFPHFFDRGKAGYIAVDRRGQRFVSEATSYHDFVPAMIAACREDPDVECHLLCDSDAIRRYGLGAAPPAPGRLGPHVRSGYIKRARSLRELASLCGIDPDGLEQTVAAFNRGAEQGRDPQFGKGANVYERFNGSIGHGPNPCIAPVARAPFYAIRLIPGDLGTFAGLRTDASARVLGSDGAPIPGLFAAGNDAASFMGGAYPGAGITLGPALVFGHIAAETAALSLVQRGNA